VKNSVTGPASNPLHRPPPALFAHYPPDCAPRAWTKAASGFSGAEVYRLETARGTLALRRWPAEHPSPDRLTWIHSVLTQAVANGFDRLPLPLAAVGTIKPDGVPRLRSSSAEKASGETFVSHDGHLWELALWLPGEADFHRNPSPARLTAAMQALAQLHQAMANFQPNPQPHGRSPGISARLEQLRAEKVLGTISVAVKLKARHPSSTEMVPDTFSMTTLLDAALEILTHFERRAPELERQLSASVDRRVPLQPAIRDIHDEHVLFVGDQVTGIIDFGAMRYETVAGDVARLLGSLVGGLGGGDTTDRQCDWQAGLTAYEAVRPLSPAERELIPLFDRSGLLLGGMNWLQWLFVDGRQFADLARVHARVDTILSQLRA